MLLNDKVIFLTGGAKGIGYHCAKAYAREGAKVAIADIDAEAADTICRELGNDHFSVACNVADQSSVKHAICTTLDRFGKIDAIHNNAGIAHPSKPLHQTTPEEFDTLINVNLKSIYYTTLYGWEALRETKGCILNTGSMTGEIGQEMHAVYTATKGAIHTLTKSMALDYASYHIRVNAVAPAAVWTPMLHQWNDEQPEEIKKQISKYLDNIHPLGYCPQGDVVADASAFLLSDLARFITGCILPVSGGAELGYKQHNSADIQNKTI